MEVHVFATRFQYQDWVMSLMRELKRQGTYFKYTAPSDTLVVSPKGDSWVLRSFILDPAHPNTDYLRGLKVSKLVIHSNRFSERQIREMEGILRVKHEKAYS